jgi:hypothetical protein
MRTEPISGMSRSRGRYVLGAALLLTLVLPASTAGASRNGLTDLVLRVTPSNFANDKFRLDDGSSRTVSPGFLIGLHFGAPRGIYELSLANVSLESDYVLVIRVSGPNVRVYRQGGPFTSDEPAFRLTGSGDSLEPAVVTVSLRRGHSPTTTTVPTTTSTTTTTVVTAP